MTGVKVETTGQRFVIWLAAAALIGLLLYPEFDVSYYVWLRGWERLGGHTERMFILNAGPRYSTWVEKAFLPSDPELIRLLPNQSDRDGGQFEKQISVRWANMGLQVGAVLLLAIGAIWVARPPATALRVIGQTGDQSASTPPTGTPSVPASPKGRTPQCEAIRQKLRPPLMYDEAKIDRLVAAERERTPAASDEELHVAAYERWLRDNR